MAYSPIWFEWKFNDKNFDKPKKGEELKGVWNLYLMKEAYTPNLNDRIFIGSITSTMHGWVVQLEGTSHSDERNLGTRATAKSAQKFLLASVMHLLYTNAI